MTDYWQRYDSILSKWRTELERARIRKEDERKTAAAMNFPKYNRGFSRVYGPTRAAYAGLIVLCEILEEAIDTSRENPGNIFDFLIVESRQRLTDIVAEFGDTDVMSLVFKQAEQMSSELKQASGA